MLFKKYKRLTKVEAARYFQKGTLAKIICGRNTELVASFLCKTAYGDLCGCEDFSSIASLPGRSTNLPPLHNVSFNGYGTVTVRGRPMNGDG